MNDAIGRVRVQPVQAAPADGASALRRVLRVRAGNPDTRRDLPRRAVDEDRDMGVNVEEALLRCLAADAVDLTAGSGRCGPGQGSGGRDGDTLEAGRPGLGAGCSVPRALSGPSLSSGVLPDDARVPPGGAGLPPPLATARAMPTAAAIARTTAPITVNGRRCLARLAS